MTHVGNTPGHESLACIVGDSHVYDTGKKKIIMYFLKNMLDSAFSGIKITPS